MRMFAALLPTDDVADDLDRFLSPRRDAAPFRWTAPEQVHLTLAFYADVPEARVDDLASALADTAGRRRPLDLRIGGGLAFPDPDRARVLAARVDGTADDLEEVERLAQGCRHAAAAAGVEVDGQRFRPHLTVARCGRPTSVTSWVRLLDSYAGPTWPAAEVTLVASHLGEGPRRRPRHEVVCTAPLGGGRAAGREMTA